MGDGKENVETEGTTTMKSYHIYLEDKCLFKDLSQEEFDVIWGRIYKSYFKDEITYSVVNNDLATAEQSY